MVQPSILRLQAVIAKTGLSRSSIYNAVKQGTFPGKISLGPRAVGWSSIDVDSWIETKITSSRLGK